MHTAPTYTRDLPMGRAEKYGFAMLGGSLIAGIYALWSAISADLAAGAIQSVWLYKFAAVCIGTPALPALIIWWTERGKK